MEESSRSQQATEGQDTLSVITNFLGQPLSLYHTIYLYYIIILYSITLYYTCIVYTQDHFLRIKIERSLVRKVIIMTHMIVLCVVHGYYVVLREVYANICVSF